MMAHSEANKERSADRSQIGNSTVLGLFLRLTLTSHIAKIAYADRQPKDHSSGDGSAQRMARVSQCLVQDREKCRLEELCRGSEQLEKFRCGRKVCCF